ncbi:30S ribosomal protein S6 [Candidatus Roizmanbacteria bacterium RIFCSPHIGHO2_01_FULL_39_12b]|uniref:Small ribosomal subunit protein bS6 n=1 Tax=Candidatus Roizmanbacteria bacterium RIFCSPHIGHO2_01_FULL_39_12b TaxID=1802030 RepID=A0A1F7G912_9BACT|nr:MAG: 30S ribosomal protein S6 [Candidatus Roizmanbacteria bacterium RIFCSPHIGHO2_01_FULL_39_12b]OGK45912.1 MAG: 30S ribosomal protein S6 [Candidatus Roizmanbacteria bacterium RIFCSPLOWO2_01_FULL_39_19]
MTNKYQFVFILQDNDEAKLKQVEEIIEKHSGKVEKKDTWGKKTFAYLINKQLAGHYFDWIVSTPGANVKELKDLFNLNHDVVRYLLLKTD